MIGGNTTITIQTKTTTKNAIGESIKSWADVQSLKGFLDLTSGNSNYSTYNAKIQESSHVFICDYIPLNNIIKAENSRLIDEEGLIYDVMLIDNPVKLNKQLEIYLKYVGGQ